MTLLQTFGRLRSDDLGLEDFKQSGKSTEKPGRGPHFTEVAAMKFQAPGQPRSEGAEKLGECPPKPRNDTQFTGVGAVKFRKALGWLRGKESKDSKQSGECLERPGSGSPFTEGCPRTLIDAANAHRNEDSKDSEASGRDGVKRGSGTQFTIHLTKQAGEDNGIDVRFGKNMRFLYIADMKPGAIEDWNKAHPDQRGMKVGDYIMQVNDARTADTMCIELLHGSDLVIKVRLGAD